MSLLDLLHKPTEIDAISKIIRENRDVSFGEIFKKLETENKLEWFLGCTPSDLFSVKEYKFIEEIEIEDVDKYKEKIILLLAEKKLGDSNRGLSTKEIIMELKGTSDQCRNTLISLRKDRRVWKTGKTQGTKWVLWEYKQAAEDYYLRR